MGYRSDVTVIMYASTSAEQLMVNEWVKGQLAKRGANDELHKNFYFMEKMVRFDAEHWKWYEGYEEVDWLNRLFDDYVETFCSTLDNPTVETLNQERTYAIEYARVGENYDDIETWEKGACQGRIYITRSINVE